MTLRYKGTRPGRAPSRPDGPGDGPGYSLSPRALREWWGPGNHLRLRQGPETSPSLQRSPYTFCFSFKKRKKKKKRLGTSQGGQQGEPPTPTSWESSEQKQRSCDDGNNLKKGRKNSHSLHISTPRDQGQLGGSVPRWPEGAAPGMWDERLREVWRSWGRALACLISACLIFLFFFSFSIFFLEKGEPQSRPEKGSLCR